MRFRVMQHNDHDWRKPCEGLCKSWQVIEADSAEEAVVFHFEQHTPDMVTTLDVKTLAEGVYMLDMGESDDDWFAFRVELVQDLT